MQWLRFHPIGAAVALLIVQLAPVHLAAEQNAKHQPGHAEVRVGIESGDLRGNDHRTLQAAIEYVASLGGGTVRIGPGRYVLRNALVLRDNVHLVGDPGKTVLAACDGLQSKLAADGDCNERQITLENPGGFQVGDGVSIQDDQKGGFEVTTATLMQQIDERTFRISAPLYLDYMVAQNASARLVFPIIGGWQVKGAVVDSLMIEGNRTRTQPLNGCRGAGIYLFESEDVAIRDCIVRGYNGDGISFQVSQRVTVEDCLVEDNAGLGIHPGSGSQFPVVRRNKSYRNGGDGLFVCWRVKHGLFENNEISGNKHAGISIGHKDTDNVFRHNRIVENGQPGVLFRDESEAMGAHRNVFENNIILDNAAGTDRNANVVMLGHHNDVVFRQNTIGQSANRSGTVSGILAGPNIKGLNANENQFQNVQKPIDTTR